LTTLIVTDLMTAAKWKIEAVFSFLQGVAGGLDDSAQKPKY
jgi:hypothetical protein